MLRSESNVGQYVGSGLCGGYREGKRDDSGEVADFLSSVSSMSFLNKPQREGREDRDLVYIHIPTDVSFLVSF